VKVGVAGETRPGEKRVALVPEHVQRLVGEGHQLLVQHGAGAGALADDDAYTAAGAEVVDEAAVLDADLVVHVAALDPDRVARLRPEAATLGFCSPATEAATVRAALDRGVSSFAFELLPRISRAQAMDALSSQALVAGYRAGLVAAERLPRFFPLLMTAAGTVRPAKVLVIGAGVAGLQAIATTRRLGAVVSAYDVRAAAAEEVRSMGASFVELELDSLEGSGGYAREMTEDRAMRQRELLAPFVAGSDVLILTAFVPGRPAPLLVTGDMVAEMTAGSVVIDLAAESGGNCDVSRPGEEVDHHGVLVWGARDMASRLSAHASKLYSGNMTALMALLCGEDGALAPQWEDEIVAGCWVTREGSMREGLTLPEGAGA
jgi:H+-translocating NAD(P) transhydrogenase subunit alpha